MPVKKYAHYKPVTFRLKGLANDVNAVQNVAQHSHSPNPTQVASADVVANAGVTVPRLGEILFAAAAQDAGAITAAESIIRPVLHRKRREKLTRGFGVALNIPAAAITRRAMDGVAYAAIGRKTCPESDSDVGSCGASRNSIRAALLA